MAKINFIPRSKLQREDFSVLIDGNTTQFVLKNEPEPGTVMVLRNGVETREGSMKDYTLSGKTVDVRFPTFQDRTKLVVKYFRLSSTR